MSVPNSRLARPRRPGSAAAAAADAARHYRADRAADDSRTRLQALDDDTDPAERLTTTKRRPRYRATSAIEDDSRRSAYVLAVARSEVAVQSDALAAAARAAGITQGEAAAWSRDPRIRAELLQTRQETLGYLADRTTALIARCIDTLTAEMDAGELKPDSRLIKALAELLRTVADRSGLQPAIKHASPDPPIDGSLEDLTVAELRQRLAIEAANTSSGHRLPPNQLLTDQQGVDIADVSDEGSADIHTDTTTGTASDPRDPDDGLPGWMA